MMIFVLKICSILQKHDNFSGCLLRCLETTAHKNAVDVTQKLNKKLPVIYIHENELKTGQIQ